MIFRLSPYYSEYTTLIGLLALLGGVLLAIPRTFTLEFIITLVFLGGTISAHMQIGDSLGAQIFFVLLTIFTAYVRRPEWFKQMKKATINSSC